MVSNDGEHADETLECHTRRDDVVCDTTLRGGEHATYVQSPRGKDSYGNSLQERFQQGALRWECPDCGAVQYTCPVCYGEPGGPGYYIGESTGETLACSNCNAKEATRQRLR